MAKDDSLFRRLVISPVMAGLLLPVLPASAPAQSVCTKRSALAVAVHAESQLGVLAPRAAVRVGSKVEVWGLAEKVSVSEECEVTTAPFEAHTWSIDGPRGSGVTLDGEGLRRSFVPAVRGDYFVSLNAAGRTARTVVTAVGSWVSIGPDHGGTGQPNIAGRVYDLAADPTDPSHLFAASPNGGLWEGFDYGRRWRPLLDETAPQTTSALAVDPGPPLRVYAATGYRKAATYMARGVLRATLDGDRWEWRLLAPDLLGNDGPNASASQCCKNRNVRCSLDGRGRTVHDIALKLAPQVIFAATNDGIYRCPDGADCTDAGAWARLDGGLPRGDVEQLEIVGPTATDPDRRAMLIASVVGEGVYTSDDGGDSWAPHAENLPELPDEKAFVLAVSAGEPSVLYAAYGLRSAGGELERRLYRSDDRGDWRQITFPGNGDDAEICVDTPGEDYRKVMHMAVMPDDPDQLMLAHVYKVRWVTVDDSDPARLTATCSETGDFDEPEDGRDRQVLYFSPGWSEDRLMYYGGDGGVFVGEAENGVWEPGLELTFEERTDGMINTEFADLATSYASDVAAFGGLQDNGYAYRMMGRIWISRGTDNYQTGLDPGNALTVYYGTKRSATSRRQVQDAGFSPKVSIRAGASLPIFTTFTPRELILLEGGEARLFPVERDATTATQEDLQHGDNWVDITPPEAESSVTVVAVTRADAELQRRFYAGTAGGKLFSGLAGVWGAPAWEPEPLLDCNQKVHSVAFDTNLASPPRLFVVCAGNGSGAVWEVSPDHGPCNVTGNLAADPGAADPRSRRLTNCLGRYGDPRVTAVVDPADPERLFVASQEGVVEGWRTGRCDVRWRDSVGVPHTTVAALTASPRGAKAVRAATLGRGVYQWVPPAPLPSGCGVAEPMACLEPGQSVDPSLLRPACLFEGSSGCAHTWLGTYPVTYYTGSPSAQLAVQALPPAQGASAFIAPPVPVPAGRGVAFVHLLYARRDAAPTLQVPALRFRLLDRNSGATLVEESADFGRSFRAAHSRYLAVRTNGRPRDGAREPLEVPVRLTTLEGTRTVVGPELLEVLPAGNVVQLEAPQSFVEADEIWRLAGWWDGVKLSAEPHYSLSLAEDRALTAIYYSAETEDIAAPRLTLDLLAEEICETERSHTIRVSWNLDGADRDTEVGPITVLGPTGVKREIEVFDRAGFRVVSLDTPRGGSVLAIARTVPGEQDEDPVRTEARAVLAPCP